MNRRGRVEFLLSTSAVLPERFALWARDDFKQKIESDVAWMILLEEVGCPESGLKIMMAVSRRNEGLSRRAGQVVDL